MGLGVSSRILDAASGRGGPAILLASEFGCRVTCVERAPEFASAARARVRAAGLDALVEVVEGDANAFPLEPESFDAALCLGASFVWGGLEGTVAALAPAVRSGGFVGVGEPYWRSWPLPPGFDPEEGEDFLTLPDTVARFEAGDLNVVSLIAASRDDWDAYESLHWLALEEWLHDHPDDPDGLAFRERGARHRERYLRWLRDLLGWAILIGRRS